ncbi:MAG: chromate transporter [Eubacteriales bacterium]|nr:chromate transporter [Eubacteriales bacterium]
MITLLYLFLEFFKTGLFSIGGGLATIPYLNQMADRYGWITHQQLGNIIAIAESTPGPIGVNAATYIGYEAYGLVGAFVATIALILPSVIVCVIVAQMLAKFSKSKVVEHLFRGLRPVAIGLIAAAGWSVFKLATAFNLQLSPASFIISIPALVIFVVFLVAMQLKPLSKLHPLVYIVIGGIAGAILQL